MKLTYEGLKNLISELLIENREGRLKELESYVDKGYFVHLFELPKNEQGKDQGHKFGINPQSDFDTPLGIYGYPLNQRIYNQIIDGNLPYALERLYLHIFKPKEGTNIVDLQQFNNHDLQMYLEKLYELYPNKQKQIFDFYNDSSNNTKVKTPGGRFWYILYTLQENSLDWNKIFRQLGIDGVIDNGHGIIHENEKMQAVFFHKLAIDHVDTIENPTKYSTRFRNQQVQKDASLSKKFHNNFFLKAKDYNTLNTIQKLNKLYEDLIETENYHKFVPGTFFEALVNNPALSSQDPESLKFVDKIINTIHLFDSGDRKIFKVLIKILFNKELVTENVIQKLLAVLNLVEEDWNRFFSYYSNDELEQIIRMINKVKLSSGFSAKKQKMISYLRNMISLNNYEG